MPAAGSQGSHRKTLAVKHQDGEPLTRVDLQYDLLYYLFTDSHTVFTDPFPTLHGHPAGSKVHFRDLYVNTLIHSSRCSKVSREKLQDNPQFADEFAKIALLSNVGRINTTMAFFPEMRTALRTYHPVPSLQKTDGNLQDAPRIKNILKSCLLPSELQNTPTTPNEVLNRSRSGVVPSTTIVNLIFIFASHASLISQAHFPTNIESDVLDFFSPVHISSESRARVFLWLCYHYYEGTSPNPFDDAQAQEKPGKIPSLELLSPEEAQLENVDTPEEKTWGEKMKTQRKIFMENKDKLEDALANNDEPLRERDTTRGRGRGRARRGKSHTSHVIMRLSPEANTRGESSSESRNSLAYDTNPTSEEFLRRSHDHYSSESYRLPPALPPYPSPPPLPPPGSSHHYSSAYIRGSADPYYYREPKLRPVIYDSVDGRPMRNYPRTPRHRSHSQLHHTPSYDWRGQSKGRTSFSNLSHPVPEATMSYTPPLAQRDNRRLSNNSPTTQTSSRSMLEQAWHVVTTTDPLDESEDEMDENTRLDLLLRLKIINRLRGKEPTPEPEQPAAPFAA